MERLERNRSVCVASACIRASRIYTAALPTLPQSAVITWHGICSDSAHISMIADESPSEGTRTLSGIRPSSCRIGVNTSSNNLRSDNAFLVRLPKIPSTIGCTSRGGDKSRRDMVFVGCLYNGVYMLFCFNFMNDVHVLIPHPVDWLD